MILNDLDFTERKNRAAGVFLGMLVGDALGRFAKYLHGVEGSSLSKEEFLKRVSQVEDLESVPASLEVMHILEIAEEFQKYLVDVQVAVSEAHFAAAKIKDIHPDEAMLKRAKYFVAKIDHPYREDPFPKTLQEPSVQSWSRLTRILGSIIPVAVFAAGENFSSIFYREKLISWVNKDMQFRTKSITICQAGLLLAKLIAISCRKVSELDRHLKMRYFAEQLVWSCPGLDPYMFHALDFEDYIDDPVFQKVRSDESIVSLANAFRQYSRVNSFEEGLLDTIAQGGDIQGNAAVCGAVLGGAFGKTGIPERWLPRKKSGRKTAVPAKAKAEISRKTKERNQAKLYENAERTAVSLLVCPAPEKEYIDKLRQNIDAVNKKVGHLPKDKLDGTSVEAEEIRSMLLDKFIDFHYEQNKWKYPIILGDKKYSSYSIYEMATFAVVISGEKEKNPALLNVMAKDGYLDILVDRLNELYELAHLG
ncbi:MAG: ADP-ribosylglycohydrolase family protein [Deltaproteobacteria bacterium]|nr:ADP-ribosylglycohydrolase family protein [Deltaproteobacteria bacterium]